MSTLSERFSKVSETRKDRDEPRREGRSSRGPVVEFKSSVTGGRSRGRDDRDKPARRGDSRASTRGGDRKDAPKRGDGPKRAQNGGKGRGRKEKAKPLTEEELDAQMDAYLKQDPEAYQEKLNDDLEEYNRKRDEAAAGETA